MSPLQPKHYEPTNQDIARFNTKYEVTLNGCWLWKGAPNIGGYGVFCANKNVYLAHRVSYIIHKGEIPEGFFTDHLCRVRKCVNPEHLEAVTHRENVMRGIGIASKFASRTHCKNGHEFNLDNMVKRDSNGRRCSICQRIYLHKRHQLSYKSKKALTS